MRKDVSKIDVGASLLRGAIVVRIDRLAVIKQG